MKLISILCINLLAFSMTVSAETVYCPASITCYGTLASCIVGHGENGDFTTTLLGASFYPKGTYVFKLASGESWKFTGYKAHYSGICIYEISQAQDLHLSQDILLEFKKTVKTDFSDGYCTDSDPKSCPFTRCTRSMDGCN